MNPNDIYDVATLNKLIKSQKALQNQAIAEKVGKQTIQTELTEIYKPLLTSHEKQTTNLGQEINKIEKN